MSSEGFDINKKNDNRETLLELAIKDSNLGYCKVAIEKEPDLIHDKDGLILTFFFLLSHEDIFNIVIMKQLDSIFELLLNHCHEDIKKNEISKFFC